MGHGPKPETEDTIPPDPQLVEALLDASSGHQVSCGKAHRISKTVGRSPAEVGRAMDRLGLRITRCQLGLFGHRPEKRIVKPAPSVSSELEHQIRSRLEGERLSCRAAWDLARQLGIPRLGVAEACETLSVKIKPCQLGAF
ncbi:MAG: hypothetical protein PVF20_09960 [Desulfobacterales bacterium]